MTYIKETIEVIWLPECQQMYYLLTIIPYGTR